MVGYTNPDKLNVAPVAVIVATLDLKPIDILHNDSGLDIVLKNVPGNVTSELVVLVGAESVAVPVVNRIAPINVLFVFNPVTAEYVLPLSKGRPDI